MKKYILTSVFFTLLACSMSAQKYFTRSGEITFKSEAPLETIEANNVKATSVLDVQSGRIEWAVLIKAFRFEKALMEEHFNENYMESSKYPKASFKGKINNMADVDFSIDGTYPIEVEGEMEIHGQTQLVVTTATILIEEGRVIGKSELTLEVADYGIKIPKIVKDNIAKEVTVTVHANYELLNTKS